MVIKCIDLCVEIKAEQYLVMSLVLKVVSSNPGPSPPGELSNTIMDHFLGGWGWGPLPTIFTYGNV